MKPLNRAEHRGADIRVEPALDVPDHLVGDQVVAVRPLHVLAQVQGPALQIVAGLPLLAERWAGDIVAAGAGQILVGLTDDVGVIDPGERRRIVQRGDARADLQRAAFLRRGLSRPDNGLTGDLGGNRIGERRRHAEQRHRAQELAAVELLLLELLDEPRNSRMHPIRNLYDNPFY